MCKQRHEMQLKHLQMVRKTIAFHEMKYEMVTLNIHLMNRTN